MDRAISAVICLVWKIHSLVAGIGVGVEDQCQLDHLGEGGLMLCYGTYLTDYNELFL